MAQFVVVALTTVAQAMALFTMVAQTIMTQFDTALSPDISALLSKPTYYEHAQIIIYQSA